MSAQDRLDALAELAADVRAGIVERNSKEWSRRREAARRLDPAYVERRRAYMRAKYREGRGDTSGAVSYRAEMSARAAKKRIEREQARQVRPGRFECVKKKPHDLKLKAEEVERINHVVAAAARPCASFVMDGAWRIPCFYDAGHSGKCRFRRTVAA